MTFWHAWMGIEGGSPVVATHELTIEGQCFVVDTEGTNVDSKRTILAELTPGDAAVAYVFDETEVS